MCKKKMNNYLLFIQANNRAENKANKMKDQNNYDELLRIWRKNDQDFNDYAREVMEINKELGRPNEPILKIIKVQKMVKYKTKFLY